MLNIGLLVQVVQQNCLISDAYHAGNYSLCTFLLKMREYYRWENDIPLSTSLAKEDVGDWIVDRENTWNDIESEQYLPIPIGEHLCDPFESESINRQLVPHGYIYSSGYGLFNKPNFFLAELSDVDRQDKATIYTSSCEYARDLFAPPAMSLNNSIYIRQEPLRRFIWEKIEEWQWKKDPSAPMALVLANYDHVTDMEIILDDMCKRESQNMIYHEIGETKAGDLLGSEWEEMLYGLPRSELELTLRAIRDHLADCISTLPMMLKNDNSASIHFYFANFSGIRKQIFPSLVSTYQQWVTDKNTESLHTIVTSGQELWLNLARDILAIYQQQPDDFAIQTKQLIDNHIK